MDLPLAQAHMATACEAVPRGADRYNWSRQPTVTMGLNATDAGLPFWYAGQKYGTWPRILVWFTAYRVAGAREPVNTRVALRNLQLHIKSKKTGAWTQIDSAAVPVGGAFFQEAVTGISQPWSIRNESDGSISALPPRDYCVHGWGTMRDFDVADLGGIYASVEHRVVPGNIYVADARLVDQWCVNVGVDFYPLDGFGAGNPGSFSGRYLSSLPDWRTSMGAVAA